MSSPISPKGEAKKRLLTDTAIQLFRKKGYNNVTVDEIIKQCQTSKGSFYHHFKSKSDIINEHFVAADVYYKEMLLHAPAHYDAKQRLRYFLLHMFDYLEHNFGQDFLTIVYSTSLETTTHKYFRNPNRKLFQIFEQLVTEVKSEFNYECLHVATVTQSVKQVAMGIIYYWCTIQDPTPLAKAAEPSVDLLIKGLVFE